MPAKPHVVVLGAGFAGLGAVRKLHRAAVRLTLINRNSYHTFLPLLYQVATSELSNEEVGFPVDSVIEGHDEFEFIQAAVTGIDLDRREVRLDGRDPVPYDYLVVGLGAVVNFFGTPGAAEHAFPLYTMEDALRLKRHIGERLKRASAAPDLVDDGALRFVIVGGGATGVEIAGAIAELLAAQIEEEYSEMAPDAAEVHVYELAPHLLVPFDPKLRDYARQALERRDVRVHLGEGVAEVEPTRVHLRSGEVVNAHTLVWAAGIAANPLARDLEEELVRGRVATQPDLTLPKHPEVYVVGDIALITDAKTQEQLPQLGSVALQAGTHAGENISLQIRGKPTKPFEYVDKGTMATIGRGAAVVEMKSGRTMTGRAAWLAWLGVHLVLLSGGEQKAHTIVDWGWDTLSRRKARYLEADDS